MDSFSVKGDELYAAQEAFRSHFQGGAYISSHANWDEGTQIINHSQNIVVPITDAKQNVLRD